VIAVWIVLGVVAYLAVASAIGRRLRRNQPPGGRPMSAHDDAGDPAVHRADPGCMYGLDDTEKFTLEAPGLLARLVEILDLCVGHEPTLAEDEEYARQQHRAEVLTEAAAELDRIADTIEAGAGPGSAQMLRDAAGNVRYLARKDTGDAVQAPTGESTETAPSFFRPDRTYQRRRWLFQCLAVSPTPFNGETRAVGFLYRPGEPATATALDPDDWEQGGWTEATKDGGRP
jgi:hypothetical protein